MKAGDGEERIASAPRPAAGRGSLGDQVVSALRTRDERFANLPSYPFAPRLSNGRANLLCS